RRLPRRHGAGAGRALRHQPSDAAGRARARLPARPARPRAAWRLPGVAAAASPIIRRLTARMEPTMLDQIKNDAQTRMQKSVESLRHDLTKLRTGRATTALVDHLKVNYYGSDMPLTQVASVAVTDARSITITPWEK